jgi:hypothetical protein
MRDTGHCGRCRGENQPFGTSHLNQEPLMNSRYLRMVVFGTFGVGLALSQQACANDPAAPVAAVPTQSSPDQADSEPATPGPTGDSPEGAGSGDATAKPGTVPGCLNDDVKLTVTFQPQAVSGDRRSGLVSVENTSDHTCKVRGHFAIAPVNAAGETIDVPQELVDQPGKAVTINLKPRTGAFAGIKWTVSDKADSDCRAGNSLKYNLQSSGAGKFAELEEFPAPEKNAITMKSLQIGTFQPSNQGVVAW